MADGRAVKAGTTGAKGATLAGCLASPEDLEKVLLHGSAAYDHALLMRESGSAGGAPQCTRRR